MPEGKKTYYTFSRIVETWDSVKRQGSPSLQLEAVPSKDKKDIYDIIKRTYEKAQQDKYDILIDIYSNDGSLINTVKYADCQSTSYWVYVNDNKDHYRFLKGDELEVREVFDFACTGYFINPTAK